jgi:hypothetical protein
MYERKHEKLISRSAFLLRLIRHAGIALIIVFGSLAIGMAGYRGFEKLSWTDSFLNAAMILGGMGPVNALQTHAGKLFAGVYALFSGLVVLAVAGLLFAPLFHRLLHYFHLEMEK